MRRLSWKRVSRRGRWCSTCPPGCGRKLAVCNKLQWRWRCCEVCKRPVEFCEQPEDVRGRGGVRHAQRFQWSARLGDRAFGRRPAARRVVCVQQPKAYADQNLELGRNGDLGADQQAAGTRNLRVAEEIGHGSQRRCQLSNPLAAEPFWVNFGSCNRKS